MKRKTTKTAEDVLITGGTGGIGYALARIFGSHGHRVVLTGTDQERLKRRLMQLHQEGIVSCGFLQDLSEPNAAEKICEKVDALCFPDGSSVEIEILINNAGLGYTGEAQSISADEDRALIQVNIASLTELTKCFLKRFYKRGSGKILNVASTGAYQPGPYTASYYASKAYVLSFTRAVREEAKKHGVEVYALCPGTTKTDFFEKAGQKLPPISMSPEDVAKAAYRGLMRNQSEIIPGCLNKALKYIPESFKMYFIGRMKA